ncbi:MAG: type II toxin-antitoxin system RelE/ParE family toxin [Chloroflexota bacterium]|nr:type II toxin-antitoxin system RelE/ParE family toxin [Chloroflexota bacterium]
MSRQSRKLSGDELYRIYFTACAEGISSTAQGSYVHIRDAICDLEQEPRPRASAKLTGREGWRIRVGDYRVIYEIDDQQRVVTVLHIGHRRDVYR